MIRYPLLNATVTDVHKLSKRSGVPVETIDAILSGRHAASLSVQMRLGQALGVNPLDLFALDPDVEALLADRERQGFPRYATDRAALDAIDR